MGRSITALFVYGYDLGGPEEWHIKDSELDENGSLNVPWFKEAEDNEEYLDFTEQAEDTMLAAIGFTESIEDTDGGYWDRRRAALTKIGVTVIQYGTEEYPGYLIVAKEYDSSNGEVRDLGQAPLQQEVIGGDYDQKLRRALAYLGLTPKQDFPRWLLTTCWD